MSLQIQSFNIFMYTELTEGIEVETSFGYIYTQLFLSVLQQLLEICVYISSFSKVICCVINI